MSEFLMDENGPYQNGYRAGYEDGRKESKELVATLRERIAKLEQETNRLQGDLYRELGSTGS